MPLTPLGARELKWSVILLCLAVLILYNLYRFYGSIWFLVPIPVLLLVFAWVVWFFRDPERVVPATPGVIVSPADGTVTHIDTAMEPDYIGGEALRCSIFLSIFDVHLNRTPVVGTVEYIKARPGVFFDARREESLVKNANLDIGMKTEEPGFPSKVVVRQSAGAIARRIVCHARIGMRIARGVRYGMIKFGSRTTLFLSKDAKVEWKVKIGDKVRAGETVLAVVVTG